MPPIRTSHKSRRPAVANVDGESTPATTPRRSQRGNARSAATSNAAPIPCPMTSCALPYPHQHPPGVQHYIGTDPNFQEPKKGRTKVARPPVDESHATKPVKEKAATKDAGNRKPRSKRTPKKQQFSDKDELPQEFFTGNSAYPSDSMFPPPPPPSYDANAVPSGSYITSITRTYEPYEPRWPPSRPAPTPAQPDVNFDEWLQFPESGSEDEDLKATVASKKPNASTGAAPTNGGDDRETPPRRMRKYRPQPGDDDYTEGMYEETILIAKQANEVLEEMLEDEKFEQELKTLQGM